MWESGTYDANNACDLFLLICLFISKLNVLVFMQCILFFSCFLIICHFEPYLLLWIFLSSDLGYRESHFQVPYFSSYFLSSDFYFGMKASCLLLNCLSFSLVAEFGFISGVVSWVCFFYITEKYVIMNWFQDGGTIFLYITIVRDRQTPTWTGIFSYPSFYLKNAKMWMSHSDFETFLSFLAQHIFWTSTSCVKSQHR